MSRESEKACLGNSFIDVGCPKSFLEIVMFRNFAFGDVDEHIVDLEYII